MALRATSWAARLRAPNSTFRLTHGSICTAASPLSAPTLRFAPVPCARNATDQFATPFASSLSVSGVRSFSSSSALLGKRNTMNNPTHRIRKRRYGFLARKRTRGGRAILARRKAKGRWNYSH